mmetsp:Transcript_28927/g.93248  ORF Transcript_28927/g.93248 Transcript_28927/m.93248 type:complete len:203 (-) Transcript_28927:431-1039(-)
MMVAAREGHGRRTPEGFEDWEKLSRGCDSFTAQRSAQAASRRPEPEQLDGLPSPSHALGATLIFLTWAPATVRHLGSPSIDASFKVLENREGEQVFHSDPLELQAPSRLLCSPFRNPFRVHSSIKTCDLRRRNTHTLVAHGNLRGIKHGGVGRQRCGFSWGFVKETRMVRVLFEPPLPGCRLFMIYLGLTQRKHSHVHFLLC